MKKINYLFICLFLSVAVVVGCKSDDGGNPPAEEGNLAKLDGSWKVSTAKRDGTDLPEYEDMTLTISKSNKTFATSGGPSGDANVFPKGSFTDEGNDYSKVKVGPNNIIVSLTPGASSLTASFKLDSEGGNAARVLGLDGSYTFTFTKQ